MTELLYSIDKSLLYFINHSLSVPFLDKFFSHITNVNSWFIAYIILLLTAMIKGGRKGKITAAGLLILIIITDQVSANVIKEYFQRVRPCNALPDILTPLGCTGSPSFPSNHAVNNFAAAVFIYRYYPNLKWAVFITAFFVAISRVYLGLHYPSDVIGGALIGAAAGYLLSMLFMWIEEKTINKKLKQEELAKESSTQ